MIGRRSTMVAAVAVTLLAAWGAQAGDNWHHHGHNGHGGNWWVAPVVVGGLLGAAAIASYPYYGYRYPAAPYYALAYPYPYPPQPRMCPDQYGGWFPC